MNQLAVRGLEYCIADAPWPLAGNANNGDFLMLVHPLWGRISDPEAQRIYDDYVKSFLRIWPDKDLAWWNAYLECETSARMFIAEMKGVLAVEYAKEKNISIVAALPTYSDLSLRGGTQYRDDLISLLEIDDVFVIPTQHNKGIIHRHLLPARQSYAEVEKGQVTFGCDYDIDHRIKQVFKSTRSVIYAGAFTQQCVAGALYESDLAQETVLHTKLLTPYVEQYFTQDQIKKIQNIMEKDCDDKFKLARNVMRYIDTIFSPLIGHDIAVNVKLKVEEARERFGSDKKIKIV